METAEQRIIYAPKEGDVKPNNNRISFRQSNIELLRIICMIMIIAHHFCVHTAMTFDPNVISFNRIWYDFLYTGGKIGVNIFILITGYFSFRNVTLKLGKLFQFYLQVFTYSLVIFLVFAIPKLPVGDSGNYVFTWRSLIDNLLPVTVSGWWFVSGYFVILLISPFLNYFINAISRTGLKIVLVVIGILFVVVPTFYIDTNFFTANWDRNPILWFIFLYLLGSYYGKYGFRHNLKASHLFLIFFGICILTYGTVIIFDYVGMSNPWYIENNMNKYFFEMQTIPMLIASVCLFEGFLKLDIGSHKSINFISSLTFGIYLFHDNKLLRELLWKTFVRDTVFAQWLNAPNVESSPYFVPVSIACIAGVFIAGGIIEFVRMYLLEPLYLKYIKKLGKKLDDKVNKYIAKEGVPGNITQVS